jgi:hypothetical protein
VYSKKCLILMVNEMSNVEQGVARTIGCKSQANKIRILKDVNGIIKPSRLIHMHQSNNYFLIFSSLIKEALQSIW